MKTLYAYLLESYGVVTDSNSWDNIIKYISTHKTKTITSGNINLAPWMASVIIKSDSSICNSEYGEYLDGESVFDPKSGKLHIVIGVKSNPDFTSKEFIQTLQHEFQHAFDDWVAKINNLNSFLSNRYSIGAGGSKDLEDANENIKNLTDFKIANYNGLLAVLDWCSYLFEPTEINAYCREFDKWLDTLKDNDINLKQLVGEFNDNIGINPLVLLNYIIFIRDNINNYINDQDHMDWDYIVTILDSTTKWIDAYVGKNIKGKDSKEVVFNIFNTIYKRVSKRVYVKYKKILYHHMMNNRLKVSDFPYWWNKIE